MAARGARAAIPPELVAQHRAHTRRTIRLYGLGVFLMAVVIALIFGIYAFFANRQFTADRSYATAATAYAEGRYGDAERDLRTALSIRPNDDILHYDLGRVLLAEQRYGAAYTELETTARTHQLPTAYVVAAITALRWHHPAQARVAAQGAVRLASDFAPSHALLAMANRALGHQADAAREFAAARGYGYTGQSLDQLLAPYTLETPNGDAPFMSGRGSNSDGG